MFKSRYFDKEFSTKKALFHALKDNEGVIIDQKKNKVYKSIDKAQGIKNVPLKLNNNTDKSFYKQGFIYPVINSTGWLDSHDDVHVKGCYTETVLKQQGRVYYIDSHLPGLSNIIARKQDIVTHIKNIPWQMLGKNIPGSTESLVLEISEDKVKSEYLDLIKSDPELENSFAMRYIDLQLCMDTNDPELKEYKEAFDYYIQDIANKDAVMQNGLFFAVKELAIMGEGSLCPVVGGSNDATRIIQGSSVAQAATKDKEVTLGNSAKYLLI